MPFTSGTAEVGDSPVALCPVGENGVRVRNRGGVVVYLGGAGVTADGYPLDPGETADFYGAKKSNSALIPAPPGDMDPDVLYARSDGGKTSRVSWIGA